MRKIIIFLMISFPFLLKAQDPVYSQFHINQLEYNPANGGAYGVGKFAFGVIGKTSFYPIRGPFKYGNIFLNHSFFTKHNFKPDIGFIIDNETQGDGFLSLTKTSINLGFSLKLFEKIKFIRKKKIDKIDLSIGFKPGVVTQSIDWNEFTFSDQLNPIFGITRNSINQNAFIDYSNTFNLGLGSKLDIKFNEYNELILGFACFNAFEPEIGFLNSYSLPRRYSYQLSFLGKSKKYKNLPWFNNYLRLDFQNQFRLWAYNLELVFEQGFSIGAGYKSSSLFDKNNNISLPLMIAYNYDDIVKIYSSWEPNIIGYNYNTFELGIIVISTNEIKQFSDFKDFFIKHNCGNRF